VLVVKRVSVLVAAKEALQNKAITIKNIAKIKYHLFNFISPCPSIT